MVSLSFASVFSAMFRVFEVHGDRIDSLAGGPQFILFSVRHVFLFSIWRGRTRRDFHRFNILH